jgi:hypothetical protein
MCLSSANTALATPTCSKPAKPEPAANSEQPFDRPKEAQWLGGNARVGTCTGLFGLSQA